MKEKGDPDQTSSETTIKPCQDEMKCSICWKYLYRCMTLSPCMHNFCSFCLSKYLDGNYWRLICPACRGEIQSCSKNLLLNQLISSQKSSNPELQISEEEKEIRDERDMLLKGAKLKKYNNRSVYFGFFKDGKREGKGKLMDSWRSEYEGEFKNDKFEGQGDYNYSSGNRYSGEWKNGRKNAFGEFTFVNGERYKGEWRNDFAHGSGEYLYVDGGKYKGEFKEGQIEGQGEQSYANGDEYKGGFKHNRKEGFGEYTFANGRKEVGEWKDNVFYGNMAVNCGKSDNEKKQREALWSTDIRLL